MPTTSPLSEAVRSFVASLPAEKGYSVHTCRAYTGNLKEFIGYLTATGGGLASLALGDSPLGPGLQFEGLSQPRVGHLVVRRRGRAAS